MQSKHHIKAYALLKAGKYDQALVSYNKALESEPNNPDILSERGVVYFHLGQKDKALNDLNRCVELEPDYAYRYTSRAYIKDSMGDINGAVEDYNVAIKLDPDCHVTLNNLGLLEEKLGRHEAAKQRFERADKLSKAEDKMFDMLDEMEGKPQPEETPDPAPSVEETPPKPQSKSGVIKDVFTSRSAFKEFIRFVGKGFKMDKK